MQAQDPGELFDLCDRSGAPLGRTKPRALVHRDGDWHRSLHVWVVIAGGGAPGDGAPSEGAPSVLFQRRSPHKDTWPGMLDVAVTGHLRAGETIDDALREAEEEIGLRLGPGDVTRLGLRRRPDAHRAGIVDNELQEILAAIVSVPLAALRPSPAEVTAIVAVPFHLATAWLAGQRDEVEAVELARGSVAPVRVPRAALIPALDGYYPRASGSLGALLGGGRPDPWEIG